MWRAVLFGFILSGCGWPGESVFQSSFRAVDLEQAHEVATRLERAINGTCRPPEDWLERASFWIGSQEAVALACRRSDVWSCNRWGVIVLRDDGDLCQMIAHELTHQASHECFGDWDAARERFDYGGIMMETCS